MLIISLFFLQNVCLFREKVILLHPIKQKRRTIMLNVAYFYGYYFYFATSCEAVGRK